MVEEYEPPTSASEPQSLWGDTSRENILDMAKRFTASSQSFMETLQTLRGILEGQIQKEIAYASPSYINPFGGFPVLRLWRPPQDFDYSRFTNAASETYEAWRIARRDNKEVAEFEGESLGSLVSLFNKLRYQPISSDGSEDSNAIAELSLDFKTKVERLEWLLSLMPREEEIQPSGLPAGQVPSIPDVEEPDAVKPETLAPLPTPPDPWSTGRTKSEWLELKCMTKDQWDGMRKGNDRIQSVPGNKRLWQFKKSLCDERGFKCQEFGEK